MGTSSQDVTSPGIAVPCSFCCEEGRCLLLQLVGLLPPWRWQVRHPRHRPSPLHPPQLRIRHMNNQTWKLVAYDPWFDQAPNDEGCDRDHCHYDSFRRFIKLKNQNPNLKLLLSIGAG